MSNKMPEFRTFDEKTFNADLVVDAQSELYRKAGQNLGKALDKLIFDTVAAQYGKEAATAEQIKLRAKVFQRRGDEHKQMFFDGKLLLTWSPFTFRVEDGENNTSTLHSEFKHSVHI